VGIARILLLVGSLMLVGAVVCGVVPVYASLARGSGTPPTTLFCGTALADSTEYQSLRSGGSATSTPPSYAFLSAAQYQAMSFCRETLQVLRFASVSSMLVALFCAVAALITWRRTHFPIARSN
jgi:hypothetical protein